MWIADRIKRHLAKKTIARKLPPILKKKYGRHKRYSKYQIDSACSIAGINYAYTNYAYAMYMSRPEFNKICNHEADYDILRNEIADQYFDGNSSFTIHDALDNALQEAGFLGDSVGFDGDDSGMDKVPDDLKNLKIRVMQSEPLIQTIDALGAIAVPMGQSDVYAALQEKAIDGWENNEPTVIAFNMQEVAPYYSYTRHVSIPDILFMSRKVFDAAPPEIQTALLEAAQETVLIQQQLWAEFIEKVVRRLEAKGMQFNEVENIEGFQDRAKGVYQKFESVVGAELIQTITDAGK